MAPDVFDRETMLDLSVNVIPLFIILAFMILFAVVAPWGYNLVDTAIQMALLIVPFVSLAVLTYYSGKAISQAEEKEEASSQLAHGAAPDTSSGGEMSGAQAGESGSDAEGQTTDPAETGDDSTATDSDSESESETPSETGAPDATKGDAESAVESRSTADQG